MLTHQALDLLPTSILVQRQCLFRQWPPCSLPTNPIICSRNNAANHLIVVRNFECTNGCPLTFSMSLWTSFFFHDVCFSPLLERIRTLPYPCTSIKLQKISKDKFKPVSTTLSTLKTTYPDHYKEIFQFYA